jgi:hypothetical protein
MILFRNLLLVLVIIGSISYSGYMIMRSPCASPLEYSIGSVDEKFGISSAEIISALSEAEKIWESGVGKDVLTFDTGGVPVNFIYDERQATADKNAEIETKIDQTEMTAEQVKTQFENLKFRYENVSREYDAMVEEYKKDLDSYNAQVALWNSQRGASHDDYAKMMKNKEALEDYQKKLEAKRLEVNRLADEVNRLIGRYNSLVKNINSNIEAINESADREFEQGEYIQEGFDRRINIYEFDKRSDLVRVLVHEFGHALGVDHNGNPESIMYHLNEGDGLSLSAEDIQGLKTACKFK